ncbi:hypothetical protein [Longimicrobium sp.]|uniref:hypothetical protein n=1 Tax=Longimicrobium sp. TaxID=2029185 RepID=UPI003B3A5D3C
MRISFVRVLAAPAVCGVAPAAAQDEALAIVGATVITEAGAPPLARTSAPRATSSW